MKILKKLLGKQKLLGNQRGMSLIEVMIAAGMAVATSLVVMKVSENANKATKKMESDNELVDLERHLTNALTSGDNCFLSMQGYDLQDPSSPSTDPAAPQDFGDATTEYSTPASFTLITRSDPGTPPTAVSSEVYTAGTNVPRHPLWVIDEIRVYEVVNPNAANEGICQVLFDLSRDVGGAVGDVNDVNKYKRMGGIIDKKVKINLNCSVDPSDPNPVRGCTAINGANNSLWSYLDTADPALGIVYGTSDQNRVYARGHLVVGDDPIDLPPGTAQDATLDVNGTADINNTLTLKSDTSLAATNSPPLIFQNSDASSQGTIQLVNGWMQHTTQARFLNTVAFQPSSGADSALVQIINSGGTGATVLYDGSEAELVVTSPLTRFTGNVEVDGWVQIDSDERLKKDKIVIEDASDKLDEISGYTYVLKRTGDEHIGFMAQQLQRVFPQAVHQGSDGYLSVSYHMLIPVLVEAHKEQKAIIKDQKAEIEKLRDDVKFLYDEVQKIKRRQEPNHWPLVYP